MNPISEVETSFLPDRIAPHGGRLIRRRVQGEEAVALERQARTLPALRLDAATRSDLELLANGALSPLTGFMGRADFNMVLKAMRLESGLPWTLPVTLPVDAVTAAGLKPGRSAALHDEDGVFLGIIEIEDIFTWDRTDHALRIYGTDDPVHPGVRRLFEQGEWFLGGPVTVARRPVPVEFPRYHRDPAETRALIAQSGWKTIVGFQTRNPIHRAHEFILKSALEIHDALLIQPLVGETRAEDIPADVRMRCYEVLVESYFPRNRTLLSVLPATMRFAGPREAVFHALIRQNYGCTHFIVGRDHAGVGSYYGPYDAQRLFDAFGPAEIGIVLLKFENTFHCDDCRGMASVKTCPHPEASRLSLSGTKVREMLARREAPPVEFTRPEVARVLMETFAGGPS